MTLADPGYKSIARGTVFTVLLFFVLHLAGCTFERAAGHIEYTGDTMGTTYNVKVVYHGTEAYWESQDITAVIEDALTRVNDRMSTYQSDSELSLFNASEETEPYTFSPMTVDVLDIALQVSRQSEGAFDITVGPLVNAYGFGPQGFEEVPTDAERTTLLERVGYLKLALDKTNDTLTKSQPDLYCDLSAVAKGYAVDAVAKALSDLGVEHAMIEVGGEVRTLGLTRLGRLWRIGIERPDPGIKVLQRVMSLSDISLATSGDYRNFRMVDGKRISHTIDPRNGKPIDHALASVSVLHESCAWADAYATALMVLGPEEGLAFAEEHDLDVLFIIHDGEDGFREVMTPGFRESVESVTISYEP